MEENTENIPIPEEIRPHTVVTHFLYSFNPKSQSPFIFHIELPFSKFERVIDVLIDYGFTDIKELELDDYAKFALVNPSTSLVLTSNESVNLFNKRFSI